MITIPLTLVKARVAAEEMSSEQAGGFCQVLYDMSEKIASASGGILGFGNKIGKEESAALRLIKTVLLGGNKDN